MATVKYKRIPNKGLLCGAPNCITPSYCRGLCKKHYESTRARQVCSELGCGKPMTARGLCSAHYCRWKNHGTTSPHPKYTPKLCSVGGCGTKATRKGLCGKHYERLRTAGSTDLVVRVNKYTRKPAPLRQCAVPGCDIKCKSHGYCYKHWEKFKRYGDPLASHPRFKRGGERLVQPLCICCGKSVPHDFGMSAVCSYRCWHRNKQGKSAYAECVICGVEFQPIDGCVTCSDACSKLRKLDIHRQWNEVQREGNPKYNERRRMAQQRRRAKLKDVDVEAFTFDEIALRDRWKCGLCGAKVNRRLAHPNPMSPSLDHILPINKGGSHTRVNAQIAHLVCNMRKHDKVIGQQLFG